MRTTPTMGWKEHRFRIPFLAVFLLAVLCGCYMPIRFDAEIELSRSGYYKFIFDGYLVKVELYDGLQKNKITPSKEKEEVEKLKRDFTRDPSTKEFQYIQKGHFKVHWEREGDLIKTKSVTFFRRNEHMLGIIYNSKAGRLQFAGRSMTRETKKQIHNMGLSTTGEIRVFTDAKVISQNATKVIRDRKRGGNSKIYTWTIKNIFAPTPSLIIALR